MDDKDYLRLAIEQAKNSLGKGGFPAGAVIVEDGKLIAQGISIGNQLMDPTSHAEVSSIRDACSKLGVINLAGATLYCSLQPCLMCFSAAYWSGISRIVFGCKKSETMIRDEYYEGTTDIETINQDNNRQIKLVYVPDFEEEMADMLTKWSEENN
jgi:tRNA(Arg) A34 adenosine deaminase TadA